MRLSALPTPDLAQASLKAHTPTSDMANPATQSERVLPESQSKRPPAKTPGPVAGVERKRRMSEVISRIAKEDRELLVKLAR